MFFCHYGQFSRPVGPMPNHVRQGGITKCDSSVCYKVRQGGITKCDSYFITKCDKRYYNVRQVLQSATLLQSVTVQVQNAKKKLKGIREQENVKQGSANNV